MLCVVRRGHPAHSWNCFLLTIMQLPILTLRHYTRCPPGLPHHSGRTAFSDGHAVFPSVPRQGFLSPFTLWGPRRHLLCLEAYVALDMECSCVSPRCSCVKPCAEPPSPVRACDQELGRESTCLTSVHTQFIFISFTLIAGAEVALGPEPRAFAWLHLQLVFIFYFEIIPLSCPVWS